MNSNKQRLKAKNLKPNMLVLCKSQVDAWSNLTRSTTVTEVGVIGIIIGIERFNEQNGRDIVVIHTIKSGQILQESFDSDSLLSFCGYSLIKDSK